MCSQSLAQGNPWTTGGTGRAAHINTTYSQSLLPLPLARSFLVEEGGSARERGDPRELDGLTFGWTGVNLEQGKYIPLRAS